MDELNHKSEQDAAEQNAPNSSQADSSNGADTTVTPHNISRMITSKRVVIPPSAKRLAKAPPRPAEPLVKPAPPVSPQVPVEPNGETTAASIVQETSRAEFVEPVALSPTHTVEIPPQGTEDQNLDATKDAAPTVVVLAETTDAQTERLEPAPFVPSSESSSSTTGSVKTTGLPYTQAVPYFPPTTIPQPRKQSSLGVVLWGGVILFLIAAVVVALFALNLIPIFGTPEAVATPTQVVAVQPTTAPSPTTTLLPTSLPTEAPPVPTTVPLLIPTPPIDGDQKSLLPLADLTGWYSAGSTETNYGDENLNAGTFQGQPYSSIIQFNLDNLPTDTQILFAAIELTGRDASRLGTTGTWQLELLENSLATDWSQATPEQLAQAKSLGTMGEPIPASDLGAGRVNRFVLSESELQLLAQQFKNGNAVFRLRGPEGTEDNLFSWESGANTATLNSPTLHLVYVPGKYVIVTNTPEPTNVLTAAAYVVRGTDQAKRNGTPTPFPPGVATATPGGAPIVIGAETALPANEETAIARAQLATAIARTTGTYTPTPPVVIIEYPTNTPVVIDPIRLSTSTPIPPDTDLMTIPIDYEKCQCQGQILLLSNRYGGDKRAPIMLDPQGAELGKLSGDLYYRLALAREPYSPDRTKRLIYPNDSNGVQQIGYEDVATGEITFLTNFSKGIAYDAAWSPDGSAIAFVSTERGNTDEIYIYDFGTQQVTRITDASELGQPWSKHPSWSPNSQQIVFWSSRSGTPQIWIMNRDGSDLHNISNNDFDERDPVWVK